MNIRPNHNPSERLPTRIWRSIFKGPLKPRDDKDRRKIVATHLILHFRPVRVRTGTIRYTHTWGLGGMSIVLFLILVATGVLLLFVYQPSPGLAYDSVVSLQRDVFFGKLVRNIHHWSANFLIAIALLHLLRVYLTGAYYRPRRFNWVIGLTLICCVLLSNFTGYLLPWDQLSYWATTIVTGMIGYIPFAGEWLQGVIRGGQEIGARTLIIFYAAHTTVVPTLIIVLMAFHFWRVRKASGVVVPRSPGDPPRGEPDYVLTLPNLLLREFSVAMILVASVVLLSVFVNAPLGEAANPGMSPNPAKAPWYFVGFQELLLHFDPLFAVVIIPLLAVIGLLLIPYHRYDTDTSGVFMMSQSGRRLGLAAAVTSAVLTPILIVAGERWIDFGSWLPGIPPEISNGLLPAGLLAAGAAGFYLYVKKKHSASNNEAIQAMFILFAVAFAILTITGVWFRGEGMALAWPWTL
jgi:quinol-cytochrome oxidoreductase complex cytochrome b subunit